MGGGIVIVMKVTLSEGAISVFYSGWQTGAAASLSRCMVKKRLLTVVGRSRIK